MSDAIGFSAQQPGLPSGGGSVHGLGETFTPDLATGTGTFAIPLDLPAGPDDIGPKLTLRYDTGSGNGPFGAGFSLPLPRILLGSATAVPRHDSDDPLVLEGAGDIVTRPDGSLGLRVDGGSWQVARHGDGFLLTSRSGARHLLGTNPGGRSEFAWHLERIEDALGNAAEFAWRRDGGTLYPERVSYGPYELDFAYEARPDVLRTGRYGVLVTTALRCTQIDLRCPAEPQPLVRRWAFGYETDEINGASLLTSVTMTGFDGLGDTATAPALRLSYTQPGSPSLRRIQVADDTAPAPMTTRARHVELVDWDGDALPDLLEVAPDGAARLWPNQGGLTLGAPRAAGELDGALLLLDVNGDGLADQIKSTLDGFTPRSAEGFARPVSWTRAPARNLADPATRLLDLDGDGRADVVTGTPDGWLLTYRDGAAGWRDDPQVVPAGAAPPVDLADPRVSLADLTGDGLADVVRVDGGGVTYWPYLGWGRWADPVRPANSPALPADTDPRRLFVVDIDGDGAADVLLLGEDRVTVWFNQGGHRFSPPVELTGITVTDLAEPRVSDLDGTGTGGLLWSNESGYHYLEPLGGQRHGVLAEIDNGLGLKTKIEYSTSALEASRDSANGKPWRTRLPIVVPLVQRIAREETTTGHVSSTEFSYHDGRFDGVLSEFAGFGRVTQDELGDEHAPTLRTVRWFSTGADPVRPDEEVPMADRQRLRAIRGRMVKEETYGLDGSELEGRPYRRVTHVWTVEENGPVLRPHQTLSTTTLFEREEQPVSIVTTESSEFDGSGNPCRTVETAWRPGEDPVVLETLTTYATDPDDRFAALPARIRQFDGAGKLVADTVNRYDERPDGSAGTRGLITARESLVLTDALVEDLYGLTPDFTKYGYHRRSGEDGWWITTFYQRLGTVTGLRGTITGPRGHTTEVRYSDDRCFAEVFTDPHGNVTTARHDPRTARVHTLTESSGAVFTARYDPLARNEIIVQPGDSPALPTIRYRYDTSGPVRITTEQRAVSGEVEVLVTAEVCDGAGRLLQKRHSDHLGDVVDEHHDYCARGLVWRTAKPFRAVGAPLTQPAGTLHTEFRYDPLGRPLSVRTPDGTTRTFAYTGASVTEHDGQSALVQRTFSPTGRIASVAEQLGDRMLVSTYDYDVKGQLRRFTGADGAVTTTTYDLLGRVLRVASPARTVVNILDSAGNPIESRTVGGHTVFRAYDACDRVVAVLVDDPDSAPVTTFTYHDAGLPAPLDAGLHTSGGRLCKVTDESGVTVFDYDAVGNPATKRSRPASTDTEYRLDLVRRADGQLSAVTFPESGGTRLTVHHQYDEVGRLAAVPGFVDGVDYDERGRRTGLHFVNGVSELVEYDLLRDSLSRQVITGPGGVLRDVTISTDRAGNIVGLSSPDPTLTASYTYDSCYRLTSAVHNGVSFGYEYDDAGNLTHKSDVGDFTYVNHQLVSAGGDTFGYDNAGNVTDAPWGSHIWDAFGRLRGVHGNDGTNALFGYDHTGRRVRTLVSGGGGVGQVLTPDELYAVEDGALVALIAGAVRRRADGGTAFLHFDHLHSLVLVTDATGAVVEQRRYDPYGARVPAAGVPEDFAGGFGVGGLVQFQARWYHPRYGRFLSPDPVVAHVYIPIAWNPYAYARGNPTSFVDPAGHAWWKWLVAAVAVVALVALTIVTFGAGSVLLGLAVAAGVVTGGVMGGITAARAGGDFGDVLFGTLTGAAICGWAAFGGAALGGIGLNLGLGATGNLIASGAIMGSLSGALSGGAMGLAMGVAEGASFDRILLRMAEGALVGAAIGGATGALSGALKAGLVSRPPTTPDVQVRSNLQEWASGRAVDASGVTSMTGDEFMKRALAQVTGGPGGFGAWGVYLGALSTNTATQTLLVDLTAGVTGAWHDEIGSYLHGLGVNLRFLTEPLPGQVRTW